MNYNDIFADNINKNLFFNKPGYPQRILMNGFISLDNAKHRLSKGEYYSLVTYDNKEQLPECYIPVDSSIREEMEIKNEIQFATIHPGVVLDGISIDGGIQVLSSLPSPTGDARYHLEPGSKTILLSELIQEQLSAYQDRNRKVR